MASKGVNFVLNPTWKSWAGYMQKSGWMQNMIKETLKTRGTPYNKMPNWKNQGNPTSIFTHPKTGQHLIRDDVTGDIIQLLSPNQLP